MAWTATLAQAQLNIGEQVAYFIEKLTTPAGLLLLAAGVFAFLYLLISKRGAEIAIIVWIFLLSTLRADYRDFRNTLFEPLQTLRDYSRPISLCLAVAVAGRLLLLDRGNRRHLVVWGLGALLLFEFYYLGMLMLFGDVARGGFGAVTMLISFAAMVLGLGRTMQDLDGVRRVLGLVGISGLVFIAANVVQLGIGYDNAVVKGRLAGIAGNAQNLAYLCVIYMLTSVYLYDQQGKGKIVRLIYGISIGVYAILIIWSGSRTNAATATVGVLLYYRLRVGRFALLAILAAIALGVFTLIFSESTGNLERFMSGTDTRSGVWERSLSEFRNYPLFGQIPVKTSTELDASESGYLRTLALMGTVGGVLLAGVLAGMAFEIIRAFRAQLQYAELAPICNLVIAGFGTVFVVSIGEGFILGIFTLPVLYIYLLYAASAFIAEYEDLKIIDVADNEGDTDVDGWNAETAPKRF
jgi:hypothetical protein